MTKFLLTVIIVVGLSMGAWQVYKYWGKYKEPDATQTTPGQPSQSMVNGDSLPGMPPVLDNIYQASKQRGVMGLKDFLTVYGKGISDPRLASIELDYVVLIAHSDPNEARRMFNIVKSRVTPDSPVYPRVQQLAKTYE